MGYYFFLGKFLGMLGCTLFWSAFKQTLTALSLLVSEHNLNLPDVTTESMIDYVDILPQKIDCTEIELDLEQGKDYFNQNGELFIYWICFNAMKIDPDSKDLLSDSILKKVTSASTSAINDGASTSAINDGASTSAINDGASTSAINYRASTSAINYGASTSAINYGASTSGSTEHHTLMQLRGFKAANNFTSNGNAVSLIKLPKEKKNECKVCGITYSSKYYLRRHKCKKT